jgi:hypothetical protein
VAFFLLSCPINLENNYKNMSPSHENGIHASRMANGHANGIANGGSNGAMKSTDNKNTAYGSGTGTFDLAKVLTVTRSPRAFSSYAVSLVSLPAGSTFAPILGTTPSSKAYSSVQISRDQHMELNSDLLYCNHSCAPTVEFDVAHMVVRVAADRDLNAGDPLTFWYPSTEWSMAQRFECSCGSKRCHGWIAGAGEMDEEVVRSYWLNEHIVELLDEENRLNGHGKIGNAIA